MIGVRLFCVTVATYPIDWFVFSVLGCTPANLRAVARNAGVSLSFDPVPGAVSYNVSVTPVASIHAAALHVEASLSPLIFKECSGFIPGLINGRGIPSHVCSCTVSFSISGVLLALLCRVRIQSAGLAGVWANRSILRSCSRNTRFHNFGPFLNGVLTWSYLWSPCDLNCINCYHWIFISIVLYLYYNACNKYPVISVEFDRRVCYFRAYLGNFLLYALLRPGSAPFVQTHLLLRRSCFWNKRVVVLVSIL